MCTPFVLPLQLISCLRSMSLTAVASSRVMCGEGSARTAGYTGLITKPGWEAWKRAAKRHWETLAVSPAPSITAYLSDCLHIQPYKQKITKWLPASLTAQVEAQNRSRDRVSDLAVKFSAALKDSFSVLGAASGCESCCPWSWTDKTSFGKITPEVLELHQRLVGALHCPEQAEGFDWALLCISVGTRWYILGWWWAYCQI